MSAIRWPVKHEETDIVIITLTTNVEHGGREVAIRQSECVINCPLCCQERVTDSSETTARRCIRFEHDKGLSARLGDLRRVEV